MSINFDEHQHARDAHGKFAPHTGSEPAVSLDSPDHVTGDKVYHRMREARGNPAMIRESVCEVDPVNRQWFAEVTDSDIEAAVEMHEDDWDGALNGAWEIGDTSQEHHLMDLTMCTADRLSQQRRFDGPPLREGSSTPWGKAQRVAPVAPGITDVSTAGHGGYKLSRDRNAVVPAPLRRPSGWYEEDCDAAIVMMTFPREFSRGREPADVERVRSEATQAVKDWNPDGYERCAGQTLGPDDSYVRRADAARAARDAGASQ